MVWYELFGHFTYLLLALSFLLKDILWLRGVSIVASCSSIVFNYLYPAQPIWLVINWNIAFIAINAVRIGLLLNEKRGIVFSDTEQELHEVAFANLSALEFKKLIRLGIWQDLPDRQVLTRQGEELDSLILLYDGGARVEIDGQQVATLHDGDFIGEMSFTTSKPASATVIASGPTRVIAWPKEQLKGLLRRNPSMRTSIQVVLGTNMANKLVNQRLPDETQPGANMGPLQKPAGF